MNSTTKILRLVALMAILIFSGCAEDGEQGPEGPKGDQGDQGEPGTANIMYSNWLDIDWNVDNRPTLKSMGVEEPELNSDFIDEGGAVFFFIRKFDGSAQSVTQLPLILGNLNEMFGSIKVTSRSGTVLLIAASLDGTNVGGPDEFQWRYILVPGGGSLSGGRSATPDFSDYETIKRYYGIPD